MTDALPLPGDARYLKAGLPSGRQLTDPQVVERVSAMLLEIERDGMDAVRRHSRQLDDWAPERFAMTWTILPAVTEVELSFTELGPALTKVALEHRGWDRLTTEQLAAATSVPGGYSAGWKSILELFAKAVEAS